MGSNDWQLYPPMHKLHKRLAMIDMFSFREGDGLAKKKSKVPYKMMFIVCSFSQNSQTDCFVCPGGGRGDHMGPRKGKKPSASTSRRKDHTSKTSFE